MNESQNSALNSAQPITTPNGTPLQTGMMKAVYTIIERPGLDKKLWLRVGTAWVNKDLSLNVKLDAHPANNQLHIRDTDQNGYQARRDAGGGAS